MRSPDEQWVSGWMVGSGGVKGCVSGRGTSLWKVEWLSLLQQELEAAEPTVVHSQERDRWVLVLL